MRCVDVPRAAPHLVEAGRLEAVLVDRSADDRVEARRSGALAVEQPVLAAVVVSTTCGARSANFFGQPALERVRRLDDVVVDRDHGVLALRAARARARSVTLPGRCGREVRVLDQFVDVSHGMPSSRCAACRAMAAWISRASRVRRARSWRTAPSQYTSAARSRSDAFIGWVRRRRGSRGAPHRSASMS